MKEELSSVDLRMLLREYGEILPGARLDKAYQVGEREIVLRLYGRGSMDYVIAPTYMCVTKYRRPAPNQPSSFAMQLRKRLKGARINSIRQHGFDRIVEIVFDEYVLVAELFSKGNLILCDKDMKILGLLDWQKWRDRVLGVGKTYEYPPEVEDPLTVSKDEFVKVLSESKRGVAATLARRFSLGGYYAEKVCEKAEVEKDASFTEDASDTLWDVLQEFRKRVLETPIDARITEDNVAAFWGEGDEVQSFNEAVDEFFSKQEAQAEVDEQEATVDERKQQLEGILAKQLDALSNAEKTSEEDQVRGDLLYQNMNEVSEVVEKVKELRGKGLKDDEILEALREYKIVKELRGYTLTLEL